jgi:hypothetical protein
MTQKAVSIAIDIIKKQFKFQDRWGNFINEEWRVPEKNRYLVDTTPISNESVAEFTGFSKEAGVPLVQSLRWNKFAFTGETVTGRLIQPVNRPGSDPGQFETGRRERWRPVNFFFFGRPCYRAPPLLFYRHKTEPRELLKLRAWITCPEFPA